MTTGEPYRESASKLRVRMTFTRFDWGHLRLATPGLIVLGVIAYRVAIGARWDRFAVGISGVLGACSLVFLGWVWSFRYRWLELEHVADALEIRQGIGRWVRRVRSIPLGRIGVVTPIWFEDAKGRPGTSALNIIMAPQPFEHQAEEVRLGAELNLPFERVRDTARQIHELLGTPAIN